MRLPHQLNPNTLLSLNVPMESIYYWGFIMVGASSNLGGHGNSFATHGPRISSLMITQDNDPHGRFWPLGKGLTGAYNESLWVVYDTRFSAYAT